MQCSLNKATVISLKYLSLLMSLINREPIRCYKESTVSTKKLISTQYITVNVSMNKSAKCLPSNSVSERKYNDFTVANKKKLRSKEKKNSKNMENTINNISQSDRKPSHEASQILPLRSLSLWVGALRPEGVPRPCVAPWSRSCRRGLWVVERPRRGVQSGHLWCSSCDSADARGAVCPYKL